jgi:hypothetical protein
MARHPKCARNLDQRISHLPISFEHRSLTNTTINLPFYNVIISLNQLNLNSAAAEARAPGAAAPAGALFRGHSCHIGLTSLPPGPH